MLWCKNCHRPNTNGTKFCSHKCRVKWRLKHEIKGAKKRYRQKEERFLASFGSDFSNEGNCQNDTRTEADG